MLPLVLASTSTYRAMLLQKLGLPFDRCAPDIDETPESGETPEDMVRRLSREKALAVASQWPEHLIIGSDQCAVGNGAIIGKPGNRENAVRQLKGFSGKRITFYTGLCLLNSKTGASQIDVVPFHVHFRALTEEQIENYILTDKPYECAGSFRSEGLGITLFSRMEGEDPNALIGLPLIRLTSFLAREGISLPQPPSA